MKNLIKKLLREGLIVETNLYEPKIIKIVTDRIGDDSDDTLNKLAIIGLYKNWFVKDLIQQIKTKNQLDQAFNEWYEHCIGEMVKTTGFIDNRPSATKFLDAYVKNIKSVDKPMGFSMKIHPKRGMDKFSEKVYDLVNHEGWVQDTSIKPQSTIYEPDAGDKVYEDENVVILDTNTKAKCVKYGTGESWCITKAQENYYNSYRIDKGATPYFVLQINEPPPEHKLVIMHYKSGYAIADQTNSPPRHGGNQHQNGPWSEIESQIPNLRGLEDKFPYREITEDERKLSQILQKAKTYDGDNLQGYIDNAIKGLVVNGSQVEAKDFIRDLAATGITIKNNQIKSLRPEILSSLIEGGYFLGRGERQVGLLSDNNRVRVTRLRIQNKMSVEGVELLKLPEEEVNNFLENITSPQVYDLLKNLEDKDSMIERLVTNGSMMRDVTPRSLEVLVRYYSSPKKLLNSFDEPILNLFYMIDGNSLSSLLITREKDGKADEIIDVLTTDKALNLIRSGLITYLFWGSRKDEVYKRMMSNERFIGKLEDKGVDSILHHSEDKAQTYMTLFGNKKFLETLTPETLTMLILRNKNPEKVINMLRQPNYLSNEGVDNLLQNIPDYKLILLLRVTPSPEKILKIIPTRTKEWLNGLSDYDIYEHLKNINSPKGFINILGDKGKEYLDNISDADLEVLFTLNGEKNIDMMLSYEGFRSRITTDNSYGSTHLLYRMLHESTNPEEIMRRLGDGAEEVFKNISSEDIRWLRIRTTSSNRNNDELKTFLTKRGIYKNDKPTPFG